jgi:hypothetical protein
MLRPPSALLGREHTVGIDLSFELGEEGFASWGR